MNGLTRRDANNRSLQRKGDPAVEQSLVQLCLNHVEDDVENSGGDHLRAYWQVVRQNLGLVAVITIFSTLAMAIYEIQQPDQYEAVARIQIGRESGAPGLNTTPNSSDGRSEDSVYFNTELQILSSAGLLRRVVKTLDVSEQEALLHPTRTFKHSIWRGWRSLFGNTGTDASKSAANNDVLIAKPVAAETSREDLQEAKRLEPYVNTLEKGLKIEPIRETRTDVKETRLIDISYDHTDPQIAAKIVNAVAGSSVYMNMERKAEDLTNAGEFLQTRISQLQSQIRREEEQLLSYAEKNQIISLDANENTVVERLAGLNRELLAAENERVQADAAYKAALAPEAAEALAGEITKQAEAKLAELRQRRAQLLVENTEEWPEVKEIDKQITEVEKQVKDERANAAANLRKSLETRYHQALTREQSLRDAFNQQRSLTLTQNQAAINYKIMQQEIDTSKGMLQALLQHAKENEITQAGFSNSIHVIDYATTPDAPVGPKRLRNVGLAFFISLGFAVGCVLMREKFDNTVRSKADVEKKLRVPPLAIVPSEKSLMGGGFLPAVRPLTLTRNGQSRPGLLLEKGNPLIAEVYRHFRATLLLDRDLSELTTILITSSLPGEGKTTTAINTAITLAESGGSVLLIDADLRRPRLHEIFEVNNEQGLTTALSDPDRADVLSMLKKPAGTDVSLLTAGPPVKNPMKVFARERLRPLFATLGANFTHIVIDSAPIVAFADSVILSAEVDGVVMVVQGGKSPQEIVVRSLNLLEEVDANVLGVVLNNTKLQRFDAYYQSYCQQYYKSAESKAVPLQG